VKGKRCGLLLVLACALTLLANGGGTSFGGFVGSASRSADFSADSLANHVTVTAPQSVASGSAPAPVSAAAPAPSASGELELHNPTSQPQSLALEAPAGVSASFHSSGGDRLTLAAGADDSIDLRGPAAATVQVMVTVVRAGGVRFPSSSFTAKLDVVPAVQ
jgi:hypothetical protein